jgi:tryptophanyl-tRNA synthetase
VLESKIDEKVMTITGIDGQKMSKSYGNTIDIFQSDKKLRKNIMQIMTDSTPLEEPKNPDTCNVFALYQILASEDQVAEMRKNYARGNYGYGHAKQALFELIIEKYADQRAKYNDFMNDLGELNRQLEEGEAKAREVAQNVLKKVRKNLGF